MARLAQQVSEEDLRGGRRKKKSYVMMAVSSQGELNVNFQPERTRLFRDLARKFGPYPYCTRYGTFPCLQSEQPPKNA
jgi:hypothetical protein